jgi:hypothetical protein
MRTVVGYGLVGSELGVVTSVTARLENLVKRTTAEYLCPVS